MRLRIWQKRNRNSTPLLIHDSLIPDKRFKVADGNIHLEDLSAGSMEFTLSPRHKYWDYDFRLFTDTFYVERDGKIIFDGRLLSKSKDFQNNKSFYVEGALSYFNDIRMPYQSYEANDTIFQIIDGVIINRYNSMKSEDANSGTGPNIDRTFVTSRGHHTIIVEVGTLFTFNPCYETCLEWLKDYFAEAFGAHIKVLYDDNKTPFDQTLSRRLVMVNDFESNNVASRLSEAYIEYGKNLMDFSIEESVENISSYIVPMGTSDEDRTQRGLGTKVVLSKGGYLSTDYCYNSAAIKQYGRVEGIANFENCETPYELFTSFYPDNSDNYFETTAKPKFIKRVINVNALGINTKIQNSSNDPLCDTEYFDIWTKVHVTSIPHGIRDEVFYTTGIDIPIPNPYDQSLTLSNAAELISRTKEARGSLYTGSKGIYPSS